MKRNNIMLGLLAILLAFGLVLSGCDLSSLLGNNDDNDSGNDNNNYYNDNNPADVDDNTLVPQVPSTGISVDDFASLESEIAPNPSMLTVQEGADIQIDASAIASASLSVVASRAASPYSYTFTSLTPTIATVDSTGRVRGILWGNARIEVSQGGTLIGIVNIFVVPPIPPGQPIYRVPNTRVVPISVDTYSSLYSGSVSDFDNYQTEPTYRLAWNWRNPGDYLGASGTNGGIDILGKTDRDMWGRTTYGFGGWFYNVNGVDAQMTNGVQTSPNGVTLTLEPSFLYDNGVPYLEIKHKLKNTSAAVVTGQKFGASVDVMIDRNDHAPLKYLPYGALMTNAASDNVPPNAKLRLIAQNMAGVTDVDTLWLGKWSGGDHKNHVYDDERGDVTGVDSAMAFSYQNITLTAGETKEYVVRFSLAR
jgi:hypothetical protein